MHDVCLDEYQDMAGIFVVEVKTYRKKERRFAFVAIGNGRGLGISRPVSLSLFGCSKQCLSSRSWFWFGLRDCEDEPVPGKTTKWHVRPAKTKISLGIRPVWSEASPSHAWRKLGSSAAILWAHSEDWSDSRLHEGLDGVYWLENNGHF